MREQFNLDLQGLTDELVQMSELVAVAMRRASTALLDADLALAEEVIAQDEQIDQIQEDLEERAMTLIARQAPVATDLRILVTALRISADLERMGDLARHVAKLARLRYPNSVVPTQLREYIEQMGRTADELVQKTGGVIVSRDVAAALQLEIDDDEMDQLHRDLYARLLGEQQPDGLEAAIDLALCGRYYERFADHAVTVARRVVYLVTGERAPNRPTA